MSELDLLPDYIEHGGDLRLAPPFRCERTLLRCFALRADREALLRLVSRGLHAAGATHLVPLSSTVLLVFAEIGRASSPSTGIGWLRETDVAFWVPLVDTRRGARITWFMPYVFVDNAYAMAAGRETLGFAKTIGRFEIPPRTSDEPLGVDTLHLPERRDTDEYRFTRLFEVGRAIRGNRGAEHLEALRSIARLTPLHAAHLGRRSRLGSALVELGGFPSDREVPLVLLRQLRDPAEPSRATLQEVIEAPARLLRLAGGGLLPGRRTLHLTPSVSHPIARDLGLQPEHPIDAAWWAEIDFVVEKGRTVSRGSPPRPRAIARPRRVAILGGGLGSLSTALALTSEPDWQSRYEVTLYQMGHRLGGKCASSRRLDRMGRIEEHGLHVWFGSYARAFRMLRRCYAELARPADHPLASWRKAFVPQDNFYLRERTEAGCSSVRLELPRRPGLPGDDDHDPDAEALRRIIPGVLEMLTREVRRIARGLDGRRAARLLRALAEPDLRTAAGLARARTAVLGALEGAASGPLRDAVDLCLTTTLGLVRDGALVSGLEALDGEELCAWLTRHGASPRTLESGLVRAFYDLLLAAEASPEGGRDLAAGAALRAAFFVLNGYRGAYLWKMSAGMGETVITPIYEVLRRRGVRFRFFHRVDHLGLSEDGVSLDHIEIGIQAKAKDGRYDPLVDVGGIACWPHEPRWDELEEGDRHRATGVDMESPRSASSDVDRSTLRAGEDFDVAVLGIPIGALAPITRELTAHHARWRTLLARVRTTATLSFQAWMTKDARSLGRRTEGDLQGGDPGALSTFADMSHLLDQERWDSNVPVRHLGYFCGPLAPAHEAADAPAIVRGYLENGARSVWPLAFRSGQFDWSLLADPAGREGAERLGAQYIRTNVEGSERYTLTVRGSTTCRLAPDGSGVARLYLAGDWVKNGLEVGCIEAAVRAGEACAAAIDAAARRGELTDLRPATTKREHAPAGEVHLPPVAEPTVEIAS